MSDSVFVADGDVVLPTDLARGPWTPEAQHGGAPAALLARAIERFDGGDAMLVVRVTVDLLRPVPIAPLRLATRLARPGKKVQLVEASLAVAATGVEVARASGLRLRRGRVPLPEGAAPVGHPPPPTSGVASLPPWAAQVQYSGFHSGAIEMLFVAGSFEEPGPATAWIRLRVPLVAGEATSRLSRVAAAADFGNGISWMVSRRDGYRFINPDLTIYLHRHPVGEWVALESTTLPDPLGVGLAESRLYDEHGPIGRSVQSLLIERE
ncbi:MAG: thioesterase family protein [Deltaproteobacteria bacterium]|nr:thioesterase family protein [Deltaproteobacteria bacterium]